MACLSMGLGLVLVVSRLVLTKNPDPKAGRPLVLDKPECIKSCRGGETDLDFLALFYGFLSLTPDF